MAVLVFAASSLVLAVTEFDAANLSANLTSLPVAGGTVALLVLSIWFWRIEKQAHDPIVRPALFESGQITKSCLISTGVSAIQAGSIFSARAARGDTGSNARRRRRSCCYPVWLRRPSSRRYSAR